MLYRVLKVPAVFPELSGTICYHVHIFGAALTGTLNKERTEFSGEWVQGPEQGPIAMTFKKK